MKKIVWVRKISNQGYWDWHVSTSKPTCYYSYISYYIVYFQIKFIIFVYLFNIFRDWIRWRWVPNLRNKQINTNDPFILFKDEHIVYKLTIYGMITYCSRTFQTTPPHCVNALRNCWKSSVTTNNYVTKICPEFIW